MPTGFGAPPSFAQPDDASRVPTIEALIVSQLRRHLDSLLDNAAGARTGDDPEAIHDMRVATRRIRTLLRVFEEWAPDALTADRAEFGWLGSNLGAVRDLDVAVDRLDGWIAQHAEPADATALDPVVALIEGERVIARAQLLGALDSKRYGSLIARSSAALRDAESVSGGEPAPAVARRIVLERSKKIEALGRRVLTSKKPRDLHRLRIACKRARYSLETVGSIYGEPATKAHRRLVRMQDSLGSFQDAQVDMRRLRAMAEDADLDLSRRTVFAMGRVSEAYAAQAGKIAADVPRSLERLGRAMKDLRKTMRSVDRTWSTPSSESGPSQEPARASS